MIASRTSTLRTRCLAGALAAAATLVALPASALGSTASVADGVLTYTAGSGEANSISLSYSGGGLVLQDTGATIASSGGCTVASNGRSVTCAGIKAVSMDLGAGNDTLLATFVITPVTARGGADNDTLYGSGAGDQLVGDGGTDTLGGGLGNDTLDGGAGADSIAGDGGDDTVTYASRTAPVSVAIDGQANDGEAGEGDSVASTVDVIVGGSAGDSLTADDDINTLSGGAGNDVLAAGGGDDKVDGGAGTDTVDAGAGADAVAARDGEADGVVCGADTDQVANDAVDQVAADCETLDATLDTGTGDDSSGGGGADAGGGGGGGTVDPVLAAIMPSFPAQTPSVSVNGAVAVRVTCPATATAGCEGTLTLALASADGSAAKVSAARRRKVAKVGSKRFKLAAGQTKAVPVRLDRRTARKLRKRGKVVLTATLEVKLGDGETATTQRTFTVRERRTARRTVKPPKGRKK